MTSNAHDVSDLDARLDLLVAAFLLDRATLTRRGLSENSRIAYRNDLSNWAEHLLGPRGDLDVDPLSLLTPDDLTEDNLKRAYRQIRASSAASTSQRRVGTLKLFLRWLQLEGHLASDPSLRIEAPDRPQRLPAGWEDSELLAIAQTVCTPPPGRADSRRWLVRDRAVFAVLATTGVRAAELCNQTDKDIRHADDGEPVLTVIGKGNRQRNLPLMPETLDALTDYRSDRDARFPGRTRADPTFLLTSGSPMTPSALNHLVDTWIRRSSAPKQPGEAAHGFRHTFAKGLIRAGVPVPAVQELLGHADLKTTGIYTRATAADVRDASLLSPARAVLRATREQASSASIIGAGVDG